MPTRTIRSIDVGAKQRQALAAMIEHRQAEIERRWLDLVRASIPGDKSKLTSTEIHDAMGDYLIKLAESLRQENQPNESRGGTVWADVAREHALTRVRLGFDIDQLVREFIVLRQVLMEFAETEKLLTSVEEVDRVTNLIESAISVAVRSYVASRDYEFRKMEAEHVAFITHELRNPLTTATMAASEVCRRLKDQPEYERLCKLLITSHKRLKELIETVLLTERLHAHKIEVVPEDTTLGAILEASLQSAIESARQKGIKLLLSANGKIPLHVDLSLTTSVIQNLVDNAVKYTDSGSVEIRVEEFAEEVIVHVHDHCRGISQEELKTIFEPFQRGHSHKPGTGLGLAIARRAVELQGGKIHAESNGQEGCHFWFNLPKFVRQKEKAA